MPKRPDPSSLLEREAAQGRHSVYGSGPAPGEGAPEANGSRRTWEDRHHRVTFHCPVDLLEELETEIARSGRRKHAVIVDALREHLRGPQRQRQR